MIDVKVNAEEINKAVAEAILSSSMGTKLKTVVDGVLNGLDGWNSPLKKAVEQVVHDEILNLVRTKYAETIQKAVSESLNEKLVRELWQASWDALQQKMGR